MLIFGHFETSTDETLYPLTLFDTRKVILYIALVLFFSEIFMSTF